MELDLLPWNSAITIRRKCRPAHWSREEYKKEDAQNSTAPAEPRLLSDTFETLVDTTHNLLLLLNNRLKRQNFPILLFALLPALTLSPPHN